MVTQGWPFFLFPGGEKQSPCGLCVGDSKASPLPGRAAPNRPFAFRVSGKLRAQSARSFIHFRFQKRRVASRFKAMCPSGIMAVQNHRKEQTMANDYLTTAAGIAEEKVDSVKFI